MNSPKRELRWFHAGEGGIEHCSADNMQPAMDYIADWIAAIKSMEAAGVIKPGRKPADYYTNQFVDAAGAVEQRELGMEVKMDELGRHYSHSMVEGGFEEMS